MYISDRTMAAAALAAVQEAPGHFLRGALSLLRSNKVK